MDTSHPSLQINFSESLSDDDGDVHGYAHEDASPETMSDDDSSANDDDERKSVDLLSSSHRSRRSTQQWGSTSQYGATPSHKTDDDELLPRDRQRRTAQYDYASEKSMSQADAKLFYQRHRQETKDFEPHSPALSAMSGAASTHLNGKMNVTSRSSTFGGDASTAIGLSRQSTRTTGEGTVLGSEHGADANVAGQPSVQAEATTPQAAAATTTAADHGSAPNFIHEEAAVAPELVNIARNIQKLLDTRHRYLEISCQRAEDNPRDDPSWRIYPPPPEPAWYPAVEQHHSQHKDGQQRTKRKPGQDIGEDFILDDCLPVPEASHMVWQLDEAGVFQAYEDEDALKRNNPIAEIPTLRQYFMDLDIISDVLVQGPSKSFAFRRLQLLEGKFNLHMLTNEYQEVADSKKVPHRDFYNVRKVDTHVHHSACMNQKHLLRFIKSKMKKNPDEVVLFRDGKQLTLKEVFESINLTAYDLSIDTLDMHAHTDSFHRFDKFNLKYNPVGESRLREIFLKTDNFINGRYLAEITKEVIADLESSKYQMVEWRISIYGRSMQEWEKLAAWVVDNKLFSNNVRWLIQVPRLYDVYKASGMMDSYEDVIKNIFQPLFEVTQDPSKYPKLHIFLQRVIGFDSVDDESKVERRLYRKYPVPKEWNTKQNPPYTYWIYYMYANMASLNQFRKRRGFNTFVLRPHCGEAGDADHLSPAFMCCHSISHGVLLRKVPMIQYLFYLDQIGIAMSPLSNNALFLAYDRNPCASFFKKGLNISLSTDDPLQFAFTKEPLIEEYAVAAQIYKLSAVDMCELAQHSVRQSGFELALKRHWLGRNCHLPGAEGNDVAKSNVPSLRIAYRNHTLESELALIARYARAGEEPSPVEFSRLPTAMSTMSLTSSLHNALGTNPASPAIRSKVDTTTSSPHLYSSPTTLTNPNAPNFPAISARLPTSASHSDLLTKSQELPPTHSNGAEEHKDPSNGGLKQTSRTNSLIYPAPGAHSSAVTASGHHGATFDVGGAAAGAAETRLFPGLVTERSRRRSRASISSLSSLTKADGLSMRVDEGSISPGQHQGDAHGQGRSGDMHFHGFDEALEEEGVTPRAILHEEEDRGLH